MDNVRIERRKNRHLNERFFIILEDFVNEYKIAKSHPDIIEYSEKLGATESTATFPTGVDAPARLLASA